MIDVPGVNDFIDLADVPHSYFGQASKVLAVNGTETGLTFTTGGGSGGGGGTTFYSETPSGLINGSNVTYTVLNPLTSIVNFALNGQEIHPSEYSFTGSTITFFTPLPAELAGSSFTIVYTSGTIAPFIEKFTGDGITVAFTLSHTPVSGTLFLYLNGVLQDNPDDYSVSGTTITFVSAPTGKITTNYQY